MQNEALEQLLRAEPRLWRGVARHHQDKAIPTGFAALDRALPSGGWSIGGVTEILHASDGIGEFSLLLPALRHLATEGAWCALVAPPHIPYAPALSSAGLCLEHLLVVRPPNDSDALWAAEQLLRSNHFAAVILWAGKASSQSQRRLQLAAEAGRTWAVTYRPLRALGEHSPVSLRIVLGLVGNALRLDLVKVRGGRTTTFDIPRHSFDTWQGTAWPIPPVASAATATSATSATSATMMYLLAPA